MNTALPKYVSKKAGIPMRMSIGIRRWRRRLLTVLILLIAACVAMYILLDINLRPVILAMAEAKVRAIAISAINDAVVEVMNGELRYTDLINIVQDGTGSVTMIQANTIRMNELAAHTALIAQENIERIGEQGIAIPAGSALGGELLAGRGPNIRVKIIPVGSVTTEFVTEFESAGINQTRHKIYLTAQANIRIVIPTSSSRVIVESHVPIAESIIVGSVPQSFVQIPEDDIANIIPETGSD